jgi:outer membrane receptor protein involved in Fe transport
MTIITADEIRQSGSRNIPEILSRVPGLDILQTGATVYDVGVRGYQTPFQPRLLVLVDGRQVFIDDYARTLWDNIPVNVDDIRQIEVVKGAASALYGSNAAGGVINIITYSPIYDNDNVVNGGFGTLNALNGDATVTHKGDWGGSKFSIGGLNEREFGSARYSLDANPKNAEHSYITNNTVLTLLWELRILPLIRYGAVPIGKQNMVWSILTTISIIPSATYPNRPMVVPLMVLPPIRLSVSCSIRCGLMLITRFGSAWNTAIRTLKWMARVWRLKRQQSQKITMP